MRTVSRRSRKILKYHLIVQRACLSGEVDDSLASKRRAYNLSMSNLARQMRRRWLVFMTLACLNMESKCVLGKDQLI